MIRNWKDFLLMILGLSLTIINITIFAHKAAPESISLSNTPKIQTPVQNYAPVITTGNKPDEPKDFGADGIGIDYTYYVSYIFFKFEDNSQYRSDIKNDIEKVLLSNDIPFLEVSYTDKGYYRVDIDTQYTDHLTEKECLELAEKYRTDIASTVENLWIHGEWAGADLGQYQITTQYRYMAY